MLEASSTRDMDDPIVCTFCDSVIFGPPPIKDMEDVLKMFALDVREPEAEPRRGSGPSTVDHTAPW